MNIILSDSSLVTAACWLKLQNFDVTLEKCDAFASQRKNNRHRCKCREQKQKNKNKKKKDTGNMLYRADNYGT